MAIEIPNVLSAAGFFDPSLLPDDPILSARGFQAYNPATNPALPDFEGVLGGFTRNGPGSYILKTIEGQDPAEAVAIPSPLSHLAAIAVPVGSALGVGTLADGDSIVVAIEDFAGAEVDGPFTLTVVRFATGPQFTSP